MRRVAFLGPAGTFSDQALSSDSGRGFKYEGIPYGQITECILAAQGGAVEAAFVPIENSLEGSVNATLDTLVFDAPNLSIVREMTHPIRHALIARDHIPLGAITRLFSHPQAKAQCRRFIADTLRHTELVAANSTADAVQTVSKSAEPWAALGTERAASLYGCQILSREVEDSAENRTRFVYLASQPDKEAAGGNRKTSIVCSIGSDRPGALLEILQEFARRSINLTKIESRPAKTGLGAYLFFMDLEGAIGEPAVGEALAALRPKLAQLRVLGSYPVG